MVKLDPRVEKSLRAARDARAARGELLSSEQLQEGYALFRSRFGPDKLQAIDGLELLNLMHSHGTKDSLVYWLEFKNDEEFPGVSFGSIAGGSAHKFGLFRRKGTNQWVTGSSRDEKNISEADAINLARKHRDQLLSGVKLLNELSVGADDDAYLSLQRNLEMHAPGICGLAWSHKYWSLLFSDRLDDYHNASYQRYHLLRQLQLPPSQDGLYVCGGRFVQLAMQLGWPINHLTSAMNERDGEPLWYWRVGTRLQQGEGDSIWPAMRKGEFVAIGWPNLGDLSEVATAEKVKEAVRRLVEQHYPNDPKTLSRESGEFYDFISRVENGDVVVAADGQKILGVGRVTGPYSFEQSDPKGAPHRRSVKWDSTEEWKFAESEALRTTFAKVGRYPENIIEIEQRLLGGDKSQTFKAEVAPSHHLLLEGVAGRIQAILERKGQAIVYGPPGTGKTYWARKTAYDTAAIAAYGRPFTTLKLPNSTPQIVEGYAR
jgi:5-methylcytosine-specific restriction protein B